MCAARSGSVPTYPLAPEADPRGPRTTPSPLQRARIRIGYATGGTDSGFTLLETLVSFILFAIVATSAAYGINQALSASHRSQQRVDAADVAQSFIAQAIANAKTIAAENGRSVLSNVGDGSTAASEQFTVIRWVTFDAGATTCAPGHTFTVNVEVHQAQTNAFLARSDTSIACPPA